MMLMDLELPTPPLDLPTPPYNQIYSEEPENQIAAAVSKLAFERLLECMSGKDINCLLEKYNLKRQNALQRRRVQLRKCFDNNKEDQDEIFQFMKHCFETLGPSGGVNEPQTQRKVIEAEVVDLELPSPTHVPIHQTEQAANAQWDIQSWSRERLLAYAKKENFVALSEHSDTGRVRQQVAGQIFDSLIKDIGSAHLKFILTEYKVGKPQNQIKRQKGQLKTFFLKNKHYQNEILTRIEISRIGKEADDAQVNLPPYRNDFMPENREEIEENRKTIKAIRTQRNEDLKSGIFRLTNAVGPNPIILAGRDMHNELRAIQFGECVVCKERWPDLKIGPKSGKCEHCSSERLRANIPATFSAENDMDPGQQPNCLKILNSVETAAISLICPQLSIYKLKGGATGIKGHSISFYQDVQEFINELPRRPEDLPILIIKSPRQNVNLTANRFHIWDAITFLKRNNPEYANININMEALNTYPDDSNTPVQNIRTCEANGNEAFFDVQNDGEENLDDTGLEDNGLVETVAPTEVPTLPVTDQIRGAILGEHRGQSQQPTAMNWPNRENDPVSEWDHGYFSKSFPNLFPFGRADITKPRKGKNPEFLAYIRHLTRLKDNRFAADPRFVLHVISMYRRHKALTLGNVFASNVFRNMTMAELKEKVVENDPAVMKSLVLFSAQIPGTKGYFSQEAKKSVAMERWIRLKSNGEEMLNVFLTFSLPDQHMEELHRLLPGHEEYLGKIVVPKLTDIPPEADPCLYIDEKTDYILRSTAINQNGHIVDWFSQKRMEILIKKVLQDTMGITDFILRSEYQFRKAIHWHMAARMLGLSLDDIRKACKKYDFDVRLSSDEERQMMTTEEKEDESRGFARDGVVTDHPGTEEFKQEVIESRKKVIDFTIEDLGLSACHPQPDPKLWPGPEGQDVSKPPTNCLRTDFLELSDLETDYELMTNRVMLHACRVTYCLKQLTNFLRCRFGFPLTTNGFIARLLEENGKSMWNEIVRLDNFQQGAEFREGEMEILRNHPRIVCHVPELLTIWRGNIDQKLIKSPQVLLKYILKYMMKPEEGSLAFTDIIKTLTANADEDSPTRKVFQRILLKCVSEHDISKNEAWRIISGKPYVSYSRPFRYLNLTGSRRVNLDAGENQEQPALGKNFCDIYWAKETDENYIDLVKKFENGQVSYPCHPKDVSLYEFSGCFTNKWLPSSKLYVPKPTPCFHFVPIPGNVDYRNAYCETTLLLHKPGATPQNLTDDHADAESALLSFTNDSRCPQIIREEFIASLKMTAVEAEINENVEDLVPAAGSQTVQLEQDDWMVGLGEELRQPNLNDPEPEVDDEDDAMDIVWDENSDWSADRISLNLTNQEIDDAKDWIGQMKVSAELDVEEEQPILPESLNSEQARVYEKIMAILQSDDDSLYKLIDVSGGAGTGKSYLINSILQEALQLSGHTNLVKTAAPTGCAATLFPGGQTIHSLLKIPPHKGCGELDDLSGQALAALQESFKKTRVLIIDEKGMIGLGRLSQINARLKQARPEGADLPFGGITILLAGDFRQLPPVGDFALFTKNGGEKIHYQGRALYRMFDKGSYSLKSQMRQQGPENIEFRDQLERLAKGEFSPMDWEKWSRQNYSTMDAETQKTFFDEGRLQNQKKGKFGTTFLN